MTSQLPPELRERIRNAGVIAVLSIDDVDDAVPLASALLDGGITAMELTMRTPAAVESLRRIRAGAPEMLAGAGTVLTPEEADQVRAAGAEIAVSPGFSLNVVRHAADIGLPFAPGVFSPTEVEQALQAGCTDLKFFPCEPAGGLKLLQSIHAPFAHRGVRFIPLGGVNQSNLTAYLSSPAVLAVGGSWLAPSDLIRRRDWAAVRRLAHEAAQTVRELRAASHT